MRVFRFVFKPTFYVRSCRRFNLMLFESSVCFATWREGKSENIPFGHSSMNSLEHFFYQCFILFTLFFFIIIPTTSVHLERKSDQSLGHFHFLILDINDVLCCYWHWSPFCLFCNNDHAHFFSLEFVWWAPFSWMPGIETSR